MSEPERNPAQELIDALAKERDRWLEPVVRSMNRWMTAKPWRIAALYALASLACGVLGAWLVTHP